MRIGIASTLAAVAALAAGFGSPASACEFSCGWYGDRPAYYAYGPAYSAPPVYSYSYFAPVYGYAPAYYSGYYSTRINVFRSPRWDFEAAYYNPRPVYRGWGHGRRARVYGYAPRAYRPYRGDVRGPIFRVSRRW